MPKAEDHVKGFSRVSLIKYCCVREIGILNFAFGGFSFGCCDHLGGDINAVNPFHLASNFDGCYAVRIHNLKRYRSP